MHAKKKRIELNFKALSNHPLFNNTQFISVKNPDFSKLNGVTKGSLPFVGVVRKAESDSA